MFEICNDLILAQRCRKGAVHPNNLETSSLAVCLLLLISQTSFGSKAADEDRIALMSQEVATPSLNIPA